MPKENIHPTPHFPNIVDVKLGPGRALFATADKFRQENQRPSLFGTEAECVTKQNKKNSNG